MKETELPIARRLLAQLVEASGHLQGIDEDDMRIEGKLCLLLELVQVLDCRAIGGSSSGGLVHRIITGKPFVI